jgi:hypothetical protein
MTVTDMHQLVSKVEPKELTFGTGETGILRVDLTVPAGTPPGTAEDVIVVAASTTGPPTSNSSVVHLSVSPGETHNPR